jgi:hypothetical protein
MVGLNWLNWIYCKRLFLPRDVRAVSTMAMLAPIPVAVKRKSKGGKALQVHNGLFNLSGNINNLFVIVKSFFKIFLEKLFCKL